MFGTALVSLPSSRLRVVSDLNIKCTHTRLSHMIFKVRKRSMGQRHVCYSVHRDGGSLYDVTSCLAVWSHVPSEGGLCLWSRVPSKGVSLIETPLDRDPPVHRPLWKRPLDRDPSWTETPLMVKSGRYTSYWNAFLLQAVNGLLKDLQIKD